MYNKKNNISLTKIHYTHVLNKTKTLTLLLIKKMHFPCFLNKEDIMYIFNNL